MILSSTVALSVYWTIRRSSPSPITSSIQSTLAARTFPSALQRYLAASRWCSSLSSRNACFHSDSVLFHTISMSCKRDVCSRYRTRGTTNNWPGARNNRVRRGFACNYNQTRATLATSMKHRRYLILNLVRRVYPSAQQREGMISSTTTLKLHN